MTYDARYADPVSFIALLGNARSCAPLSEAIMNTEDVRMLQWACDHQMVSVRRGVLCVLPLGLAHLGGDEDS